MADTDQSIYNIRYNQVTQGMEGFGGGTPMWTPLTLAADGGITQLTGDVTAGPGTGSQVATVSSTAAVKTIHADAHANLTGNVQLVSGTNVTLTQVGQAITIAASGGGSSPNIVQFIDTAQSDNPTATPTPTTTAVAITSSVGQMIRITATGSVQPQGGTMYMSLFKDGVNLATDHMATSSGTTGESGAMLQFLDTATDSAAHTYAVYIWAPNADVDVLWGNSNNSNIIIAEEVH